MGASLNSKKAGSGELIFELLLATIVFFIVLLIIFAFDLGRLDLKVKADILTADSAYQCTESLSSLLKTPVSTDYGYIPYGEYVTLKYAEGDTQTAADYATNNILAYVYGQFAFNISSPDEMLTNYTSSDKFDDIEEKLV